MQPGLTMPDLDRHCLGRIELDRRCGGNVGVIAVLLATDDGEQRGEEFTGLGKISEANEGFGGDAKAAPKEYKA